MYVYMVHGTRVRIGESTDAKHARPKTRLQARLRDRAESSDRAATTERARLFTASFACLSSDFIDHEHVCPIKPLFSPRSSIDLPKNASNASVRASAKAT